MQLLNIYPIFLVLEVLKFDIFSEIRDIQLSNILNIDSIFKVLKLDKSKEVNFSQPLNI